MILTSDFCNFVVFRISGSAPDASIKKLFSWRTKKDPKGLKKTQPPKILQITETSADSERAKKKRRKKRRRKCSILRASPDSPTRGGRSEARASVSPGRRHQSPSSRRAPVVPGLSLSPPGESSSTAAGDTPNRRRAARRSRLLQCRNIHRGCTENVSFASVESRNRHERFSCRALNQVIFEGLAIHNYNTINSCIIFIFRILSGLFLLTLH